MQCVSTIASTCGTERENCTHRLIVLLALNFYSVTVRAGVSFHISSLGSLNQCFIQRDIEPDAWPMDNLSHGKIKDSAFDKDHVNLKVLLYYFPEVRIASPIMISVTDLLFPHGCPYSQQDLADFLHRTPSPPTPVVRFEPQENREETPIPRRTVHMADASVVRTTSVSSVPQFHLSHLQLLFRWAMLQVTPEALTLTTPPTTPTMIFMMNRSTHFLHHHFPPLMMTLAAPICPYTPWSREVS